MQRINCGLPPNPWSAGRILSETPAIDPPSWVRESDFGRYTHLGARCSVTHSEIGDWDYAMGDNQIAHARIGEFCNIAAGVRINSSHYPWWRATLQHFTYRRRSHGFALADDAEFFPWRVRHHVMIGTDVWIGHNAIIMPGAALAQARRSAAVRCSPATCLPT